MNLQHFAALLRMLRKERGYTQTGLEKILQEKIPNTPWLGKVISRWETGKLKYRSEKYKPLVGVLDQLLEASGELLRVYDGVAPIDSKPPDNEELKTLNLLALAKIAPDINDAKSATILSALADFFSVTGLPVVKNERTAQFVADALKLGQ